MDISLTIRVVPEQPPHISWSGSADQKRKLSKMDICDRLKYLDDHTDIIYQVEPWSGTKNKSKAESLKEVGMKYVKSGKYVEAIQSFNFATRTAPSEVRFSVSILNL